MFIKIGDKRFNRDTIRSIEWVSTNEDEYKSPYFDDRTGEYYHYNCNECGKNPCKCRGYVLITYTDGEEEQIELDGYDYDSYLEDMKNFE